jgi:hypothetical protein
MYFAGTFDGYSVRRDLRTFLPEVFLPWFQAQGRLPELSLTMARALLFGFQRWNHMTGYGYVDDDSEWMPCIRALMDRIRQLVLARETGQRPPSTSRAGVEDALMDAYERTLEGYLRWGGYRFHGWTNFPDSSNFQGPLIWSEADCAFRLGLELEREFPRAVHTEFAIGKATRLDYDSDVEKRQRVDLVVSDLSTFVEDDTSQDRFRNLAHDAFIEAKWLVKGWRGNRFEQDAVRRVQSVYGDITKLCRHLELGRCRVAAVAVFDDEDYFATSMGPEDEENLGTPASAMQAGDDVPGPVWRLVLGPRALRARGQLIDFAPS